MTNAASTIVLREWESTEVPNLSGVQIAAIAAHQALSIVPICADLWKVSATHYVGIVHLPGLTISIEPKVSVRQLMTLLCESMDTISWQNQETLYDSNSDLLGVVADSFCLFVERLFKQGLLHGYQQIDETSYSVRGRIRLADQICRHAGSAIPVEVGYDEFTPNIIENQLLAGACSRLLLLKLAKKTRARLLSIGKQLINVEPMPAQNSPPEPHWTRLNERYTSAVFIARLILSGCSLEKGSAAQVAGSSFLVNMNTVFEDVVGLGVSRAFVVNSGYGVSLQKHTALDRGGEFSIRPDIVCVKDGMVVSVFDVKYKLPTEKAVASADIYQALTYAYRYGLDTCTLLYAEIPRVRKIEVEGIQIRFDWVDLAGNREERELGFNRVCSQHIDNIQPV